MSTWDRIKQKQQEELEGKQRVESENARRAEEDKIKAEQAKLRAQELLSESGAVRSLEEVKRGIGYKNHMDFQVSQEGGAKLQWGDSRDDYSSIEVSADPQTDSIKIGGKTIQAEEWQSNKDAIVEAVADAYLSPKKVRNEASHHESPHFTGTSPRKEEKESIGSKIGKMFKKEGGYTGRECCHCLSEGSLISTPSGNVNVEDLRVGDLVWTINTEGKKVKSKIIKTSKIKTKSTHKMLRIVFNNGATLDVSPGHPDADGYPLVKRIVDNLSLHELNIKDVDVIFYEHDYTYDILPDSISGAYLVNGVLLGSTLSPTFKHESLHKSFLHA